MVKRANEDPQQSESAAKRAAVVSEKDLLQAAQASLDRMDYKTAHEICTEVSSIERMGDEALPLPRHPTNSTHSHLFRSSISLLLTL